MKQYSHRNGETEPPTVEGRRLHARLDNLRRAIWGYLNEVAPSALHDEDIDRLADKVLAQTVCVARQFIEGKDEP